MAIGIDMRRYQSARKDKAMGIWPAELENPSVEALFLSGQGTIVSSNFARGYGVRPGDVMHVNTPSGAVSFKVLGEVDDYSWQHGSFILELAALEKLWKDDAVSYIDVSVGPGHTIQEVKARIQSVATTDRDAFAYDRVEIQQVTNSVLEQAVAMADLQAMIGILIGVLGVVNAIWIGVMNRKREIALWRAIGVLKTQVTSIVLYEGIFVAIFATLVGTIGGLYGGWVPLRSFSYDTTGYLYPIIIPWAHLAFTAVLALALGLLAGLFPARQAAKLPILDSIGYE